MRIWVIIPVYNAQRYVRNAVESVLCAEEKDISIILVDDGSTDQSGVICDQLSDEHENVAVIHQKNGGVSSARNVGIEFVLNQCDEGFIAFLDADDLWAPGIKMHGLDPDMDIVAFSSVLTNAEANRYGIYHRFENKRINLKGANVQWLSHGHFGECLYSIRLFKEYSIRFMLEKKVHEDIIFWRQATFCARIIECRDSVLYIYRMNQHSVLHMWKWDSENALHIPMAWYEARKWIDDKNMFSAEEKQRWIQSCEELIAARLLESARVLGEQGYSTRKVKATITQSPVYGYLERIKESALSPWQRKDLRLMRRSFTLFVEWHRIRGVFLRMAKLLMRVECLRKLREKKRYPIQNLETME